MERDSFFSCLLPELSEFDDWCYPALFPCSTSSSPSASTSMNGAAGSPSNSSCSASSSDQAPAGPDPMLLGLTGADQQQQQQLPPAASSASFTSVLKLSDIASALHGFSTRSVPPRLLALTHKERPLAKALANHKEQAVAAASGSTLPALGKDEPVRGPHVAVRRLGESKVCGEPKRKPPVGVCAAALGKRPAAPPVLIPGFAKRLKVSPSPASIGSPDRVKQHGRQTHSAVAAACPKHASSTHNSTLSREGLTPREAHIQSERQRRKSMRESFSVLQSLVPKLKLKHTDRITVLTEVITYIQSLRGTIEELERKKADIMAVLGISDHDFYWSSSKYVTSSDYNFYDGPKDGLEVTVRQLGTDVFITLNIPKKKGVWSGCLMFLQAHDIDIVNATLATSGESCFHCIHGKVTDCSRIEGDDLQDKLEGVIMKELRRQSQE